MKVRILFVLVFLGLLLFFVSTKDETASASASPRTPVIVELFTSEGCSSCPPADALLRKLEETQPVPNAEIIVLGDHVDYWNYIGWTDRFSSKQFTDRQNQYGDNFRLDSVYTPQMVVDGNAELNGADEARAKRVISEAAEQPKLVIALSLEPSDMLKAQIVSIPAMAQNDDVLLAITESGLQSQVDAGENGGRTLRHTGVVRELKKIGTTTGASFSAQTQISVHSDWKRKNLRAVVFVQDPKTRHILGASSIKIQN